MSGPAQCAGIVFPTHVGVFLPSTARTRVFARLPHARGGVSIAIYSVILALVSSPRTWGCFLFITQSHANGKVFPTHVGVFLELVRFRDPKGGLPHARGGVSIDAAEALRKTWSSPRTWGCFHTGRTKGAKTCVFPTHVGVFLLGKNTASPVGSLPHARGGVSIPLHHQLPRVMSSPRTWGCFHRTYAWRRA